MFLEVQEDKDSSDLDKNTEQREHAGLPCLRRQRRFVLGFAGSLSRVRGDDCLKKKEG